jgi:hypothetical protein
VTSFYNSRSSFQLAEALSLSVTHCNDLRIYYKA